MEDKIDDLYKTFIQSDEYNKKKLENEPNLKWAQDQMKKEEFLQLEKEVSDYVIQNDRDMFRNGFKCAWELFNNCNEKKG